MLAAALFFVALLLLTGVLLAPPRPPKARRKGTEEASPSPLGAPVGPFERWEAERKGQELLRRLLTADEYAQLHADGYLAVPSRVVAGRVYRVPRWRGFVERHDEGAPPVRLCLVPDRWIPDADIVLMHKYLIEADETAYLRQANHLGPAQEPAGVTPPPVAGPVVATRPCRRA